MKTELVYLLLTAILTGVLWIPVVVGYAISRGPLKPSDYKTASTAPLPDWVNRANRAHMNAVENFAQFAAVVLIAQLASVSTPLTTTCAAIYFSPAWATPSSTSAEPACSWPARSCSPSAGSRS